MNSHCDTKKFRSHVTFLSICVLFLLSLQESIADTDVQSNNKQGKATTPLMDHLSCAKKARRIEKLDNKTKRRKYIKQCQAERKIRLTAEKEAADREEQKIQSAADKVFQEFLDKGKERANSKIDNE